MEKRAFQLLRDAESTWWYRGRSDVVRRTLALLPAEPHNTREILDVGAGFGGMHSLLQKYGKVYGVEPDRVAKERALEKGYESVFSSLTEARVSGVLFDVIGAFDVLEHTENDVQTLQETRDLLKKDGYMIITVPANPFLWSDHDVLHHHHRRYTRRVLRDVLSQGGYTLRYLGHWNMSLFPLAVLARVFGQSGEGSMIPGSFIDRAFSSVVLAENRMIPRFSLPFGVSLVALAQKKG